MLQSKLGVLQRIMRERNHGRIQLFAGKTFGLKVTAQCGIRGRFPLVDFIDPRGGGLGTARGMHPQLLWREKLKVEKLMVRQRSQFRGYLRFERVVGNRARNLDMSVLGSFHFNRFTGVSMQAIQLIENGDLQFREHGSAFPGHWQMGRMDRHRVQIARSCIRRGIEHRIRNRGTRLAFVAGLHKAKLMHIAARADTQGRPHRLKPPVEHQGRRYQLWMTFDGTVRRQFVTFFDSMHAKSLPGQSTEGIGREILIPEFSHGQ